MRSDGQDKRVFLRANSKLVAEARAVANRHGKSLSELIRQAVRRELAEIA